MPHEASTVDAERAGPRSRPTQVPRPTPTQCRSAPWYTPGMSSAAKVIDWNGHDVPETLPTLLRELPPGQYTLERVLTPEEAGLTPDQAEGIRAALRSLDRGEGIPWETVRADLLERIARRDLSDTR